MAFNTSNVDKSSSPYKVPMRNDLSNVGWLLIEQSETIQERVFCRLLRTLDGKGGAKFAHQSLIIPIFDPLPRPTVEALRWAAYNHPASKGALSNIPIFRASNSFDGNDEVCPWLQDLADIVAWESTQAFEAEQYPGILDLDPPIPGDDWIVVLMGHMQRELDREAIRVNEKPLVLEELPFERQRALAERRRYWFQQFGIMREQWKANKFSLWDVSRDPMPEIRLKWH